MTRQASCGGCSSGGSTEGSPSPTLDGARARHEADAAATEAEGDAAVSCAAFLAAFEATWLYEHYFVFLRSNAFDEKRMCE
jgi:hypothetical protein